MARPSGFYVKKKTGGGAVQGRQILREEARIDMTKIVETRTIPALAKFVENWSDESRPSFGYEIKVGSQETSVRVFVKNPPESLPFQRWQMVDVKGRKGGKKIRAKQQGKPMRWRRRIAKTMAGAGGAGFARTGSGNFVGDWKSAMEVTQGAVEPRHISEQIAFLTDKEMSMGLRRAYRRSFRRIFGRSI